MAVKKINILSKYENKWVALTTDKTKVVAADKDVLKLDKN